jgi:hypothetical protein
MRLLITSVLIIILNSSVDSQVKNDILENITQKFQAYCKTYPREEIFVQSDRDVYITGEEVHFSIFLFDRQNATLTGASRVAYFEILNQINRPVAQVKVGLYSGTGSGRVVLPDTLSPGEYTLRAYTNWMKNFMPSNCFSRKIKVYGAAGDKNFSVSLEAKGSVSEKEPVQNGFKACVNRNGSGLIEVVINADSDYRARNRNTSYIFLETHGVINYKSAVTLSGDTNRFEIPVSDLIPGINHLTVFDSSGKPVSETYSYTMSGDKNIFHLNVTASESIRPRGEILVDLEAVEPFSKEDSSILSISVVPKGTKIVTGIADYMVFGSEFGQLPDRLLETQLDDIPDTILNNFLLTAKSKWIDWDLILSDQKADLKYQRETRYHYLYGSMFNPDTTDSSLIHYVFLSIPGKNSILQYSNTEPDGSFCFALPVDDKTRDLIIQRDEKRNNNKIVILSSFSDRYPAFSLLKRNEISLPAIVPKLGLNYRVMKIYRNFEQRSVRIQEKLTSGTKRFYGKPDIGLIMENFIKLPTMQEVFFELLPGISVKSENEGYKVIIKDLFDKRSNDDPLLLIDGVVISDPALIFNLDPESVEKIDVIKSRYVLGDYVFSGVINVITTKGIFENIRLPEEAVRLLYRDFEPVAKLDLPDYSLSKSLESHVPDFRNTLYWNNMSLSASGKKVSLDFFASDFISDYDIIIQGVTTSGKIISQRKSLIIQK